MWDRALTAAEAAYVSSSTATTPPELPIPGPPPPPPANPPQNTTAPSISQLFTAGGPTGTYFCNAGTWTNLPSPPGYTYRWIATENGTPVTIADGQTFRPTNAIYGYPIVCEVTVQGPTAPVTASSNSVFFTVAGLNKLPPVFGDVRVKGIDVFQIVQPNSEAVAYGRMARSSISRAVAARQARTSRLAPRSRRSASPISGSAAGDAADRLRRRHARLG